MAFLRSWLWPILALVLVPLAIFAPVPGDLSEPRQSKHLFDDPVLIFPEHGAYRFFAFSDVQWKKFKPVYAATLTVSATQHRSRALGWQNAVRQEQLIPKGKQAVEGISGDTPGHGVSLGFFHRSATWKYQLAILRFDKSQGEADGPMVLSDKETAEVRPMLVAELNRRAAGRGDLLNKILDSGEESSDSVFCWQNIIVLLAWLSLAMAMFALVARLTFARRIPTRSMAACL